VKFQIFLIGASIGFGKEYPQHLPQKGLRMPSVLFVCTANRFRSPLAAACFRKALEEEHHEMAVPWIVGSAGTWATPGQPVIPPVLVAAQKLGLDLAQHRSARVSRQLLAEYDLILVMQASQKEALQSEFPELSDFIYLFSHVVERGSYDIPDALDSDQDVVTVGLEMDALVRRGLIYMCVLATALHNKPNRKR
jgi:protein-tyrosine-phosphatase